MGCTVQVGKCAYLPVNVLSLPPIPSEIFMHSHNVSFSKLIHPQAGFPLSYLLHPVAISFPLIHEILSPSLDISAYTHYPTERPKISTGTIYLQVLLWCSRWFVGKVKCPELGTEGRNSCLYHSRENDFKSSLAISTHSHILSGIFFFF